MAFLFAALTGWSALARRYPEHGTEHGEPYRLRGVVVGEWGWSAPPATGYLDDYGILLVAKSPFGVPFRPIHVPWGDVKNVTRRKYMFFEVVEMRYGKLADPSHRVCALAVRFRDREAPRPRFSDP